MNCANVVCFAGLSLFIPKCIYLIFFGLAFQFTFLSFPCSYCSSRGCVSRGWMTKESTMKNVFAYFFLLLSISKEADEKTERICFCIYLAKWNKKWCVCDSLSLFCTKNSKLMLPLFMGCRACVWARSMYFTRFMYLKIARLEYVNEIHTGIWKQENEICVI